MTLRISYYSEYSIIYDIADILIENNGQTDLSTYNLDTITLSISIYKISQTNVGFYPFIF